MSTGTPGTLVADELHAMTDDAKRYAEIMEAYQSVYPVVAIDPARLVPSIDAYNMTRVMPGKVFAPPKKQDHTDRLIDALMVCSEMGIGTYQKASSTPIPNDLSYEDIAEMAKVTGQSLRSVEVIHAYLVARFKE